MKKTKFLFVSCCLEQTRADVQKEVVDNLVECGLSDDLTVFDNGSTIDWVVPHLKENFKNVYVSSRNVGYWSAVYWWLNNVDQHEYTYVIESDMIHYALEKLAYCEVFLDENDDVGSVRLHEYSVANKHLYNKDAPRNDSKKKIWQSHTNKVTGEKISHSLALSKPGCDIYRNNFLTQLPALNRASTMKDVFDELIKLEAFSERDFQRLYWEKYQQTAIVDGGIFHCDPGSYGKKVMTGSWSSASEQRTVGYQNTRQGNKIVLPSDYEVTKA